ncbi:MAG: serine dehydrogenasease [Verrucomicrobia bacterium]|nr:serine dehydrogenasease [Verrucomicrobiota bacterium]
MTLNPLDDAIKRELDEHLRSIEDTLVADAMAIVSPILPGLDLRVRAAVEAKANRRNGLVIILDTPGGIVEVVERMVSTVRHYYPNEVVFVIPNRAMSAGTVFVMSGDRILMDHFSCLGPIDPQIEKDGRLLPALSYLNQFERLNAKAAAGQLTSAEYALLSKLDLAELHQFEQARDLSTELLKKWLSKYKFKNWTVTEGQHTPVTPQMREQRAAVIADLLNKNEKWHSHGRGIAMATLVGDEFNSFLINARI